MEVEGARVAKGLTVKKAVKLLGLSRTSYYRQVRGMKDYTAQSRKVISTRHSEVLREVALKRVEAGHRRVRAYAVAWGKISQDAAGSSQMSCYRVLKSAGLIQPKRIGHDLREAAERRRQTLIFLLLLFKRHSSSESMQKLRAIFSTYTGSGLMPIDRNGYYASSVSDREQN
jgi:hypothetical protein